MRIKPEQIWSNSSMLHSSEMLLGDLWTRDVVFVLVSATQSVVCKEMHPLICLNSDMSVPGCLQVLVLHGQSIIIPCTMPFYFWFWRTLVYLPCTGLFSRLFSYSVYLFCVWSIILTLWATFHCTFLQVCLVFVNGGPECSTCKFLRNLQSGLILLFALFWIPLLIVPNSLLAFLAATYDWSDIFIELSVITSNFLYGVVVSGLEPITVYLKLDCFLNGHLFYIDWQRIL